MAGETVLDGVLPSDIGLPDKFEDFRPVQRQMVDRVFNCKRRFSAHAVPTGGGKSVGVVTAALLEGKRTAILTSTKGLQEQYLRDFESIGLVNVMGRNNFFCVLPNADTCEDGMHLRCPETIKRSGPDASPGQCPYRQQYERALGSQLVLTNYAYWCAIHRYAQGLGTFDLLVLDEAHDAPDEVSNCLAILVTDRDVDYLRTEWPKEYRYVKGWMEWAVKRLPIAEGELDRVKRAMAPYSNKDMMRAARSWSAIVSKLKNLSDLRGEWVVQPVKEGERHSGYRFDCVWPRTYSEELLFLATPKVILSSATVVPRTLHLLGVPATEFEFHSYPSTFPVANWPVYQIPTAKLSYKSGPEDYYKIVRTMDEILSTRLDRKCIIHTGSYARAKLVLERSRYPEHMLSHTNGPGEAMAAVERFKRLSPPAILVSPSVTTGYDFPDAFCEVQIIIKAPYPDLSSLVQVRRMEQDRLYPAYEMAQTLAQACGRAMRAETDRAESFILDDAVSDVMKRTPKLFPDFFRAVYQVVTDIPPPPPPLAAPG